MSSAVILAAGEGKRLRPFTERAPKPLVPVGGRPLLDRQLDALQENGVEQVTIVAGHLEEVLRNHLAKRDANIHIVSNPRYAETNSMFSLLLGLANMNAPLWVIEGDVVFSPALLRRELRFPITWLVDTAVRIEGSHIRADSTGRAQCVEIERDIAKLGPGRGKSVGILYVANGDALAALREWLLIDVEGGHENDYYDLVIGRRLPSAQVGIADVAGEAWYEVDTADDLRSAEALFS